MEGRMQTQNPTPEQVAKVRQALGSTLSAPYPGVYYRGRFPGTPTNESVGRVTGVAKGTVAKIRKGA